MIMTMPRPLTRTDNHEDCGDFNKSAPFLTSNVIDTIAIKMMMHKLQCNAIPKRECFFFFL